MPGWLLMQLVQISRLGRRSGSRFSGRDWRLPVRWRVHVRHALVGGVVRFAFAFALEFVFFLALFRKLLLALFVGIIGSCHSLTFVSNQALL